MPGRGAIPTTPALRNGTQQRVGYDTNLHPWINQSLLGMWNWGLDASLFKVIPIGERVKVRFNADFFNVMNNPGTPGVEAGTGLVSLRTSANAPRQLQLTLRVIW